MGRAGRHALGAAGRWLAYAACLAWAVLGAACTDGTTPACEAGACAVVPFGGDATAADATDDASADDAAAQGDAAEASAGDGGPVADTGAGGG